MPAIRLVLVLLLLPLLNSPALADGEKKSGYKPVTTAEPGVPVDRLKLMLRPLTKEELATEVAGWVALVKAKAQEIANAELGVRQTAEAIKKTEDQPDQKQKEDPPKDASELEKWKAAQAAKKAAKAKAEAEAAAARDAAKKDELLASVVTLREERTALIDRTRAVLAELKLKGGDGATEEKYLQAVSGIDVDVTDAGATWTAVTGWLSSTEGGLRWALNVALFLAVMFGAWIASRLVGAGVGRTVRRSQHLSSLLKVFAVSLCRRLVLLLGFMVALSMLEVNIGPMLAAIGAIGFVVAFALQSTLANFASGVMILIYRPFDEGHLVEIAGVSGKVSAMNLVSTTLRTPDNQVIIVPNNSIWGGIIRNVTGSPTRRLDLTFGIGYSDDIGLALRILGELTDSHPKVLQDPGPVIRVHELGDSSVNLICRPWVTTADYWELRWDLLRQAKERFDAAGISIPFPQRDVHMHTVPASR